MRFSGGWLLGLVGCIGTSVAPSDDDDDIVPIEDTFPDRPPPAPSDRNDVNRFTMAGVAVWDDDEEVWRGTAEGNGFAAQPPGILFTVIDSSEQRACQVFLTSTEPTLPPAQWATDAGAILGFELIPGQTEVLDGCAGLTLPTEFDGDVGAAIAKWTWGFALRELDDELRIFLSDNLPASEWDALEPVLAGSSLFSDLLTLTELESTVFDLGTARAFEIDPKTGALLVNGTGDLMNVTVETMIVSSDELAPAYYDFDPGISISGNALLLEVPDLSGGTGDTGATP